MVEIASKKDYLERLQSSLNLQELSNYIASQANNFFPDANLIDGKSAAFLATVEISMQRYALSASNISIKYYCNAGRSVFSHLMSDQYAQLLYMLANELGKKNEHDLASKIYYLNKALHSLDIYYQVELPDIFLLSHPVGSVLGRASYENYFVCYQNCSIGGGRGGSKGQSYPDLGEGVVLYKGSFIAGSCKIGNNVHIAAHASVLNQDIPDNSIASCASGSLELHKAKSSVKELFFL